MENDPGSHSATIEFTFRGSHDTCSGKKKRRLLPYEREKFAKKMVDEKLSAIRIRSQEAARIMTPGDPEPSTLPSLNALRLIKSHAKQISHLDQDPIMSVVKMKGNAPFNSIIHDVGYDPFFIHYWSVAQLNAYRIYSRSTQVTQVSIDATGNIVRPINLLSGRKTRAIFFYEVAVRDFKKKLQFSVAHMISERHNNTAIAFFLLNWMREDIKPPNICVTDQSLALMMACVRAFTQYGTLNQYISVCSSLLRGERAYEVPLCMIRNDFAHIMHLISAWKEIKDATRRSKDFYLRTIAILISTTSFEQMKKLLECFFIVLLNEDEGFDEDGMACICETAKLHLKKCIKSTIAERATLFFEPTDVEVDKNCGEDKCDKEDNEDEKDTETDVKGNIFNEIVAIYEECDAKVRQNKGDRDNLQYCPALAKKFLKFCKSIVLWSGIMVPIFNYGDPIETSTASESSFKTLKVDVFKHETLPIRLDDFISGHIEYILGSTNIVIASEKISYESKTASTEILPREEEINVATSRPEAEENWRGQNVVKLKKTNYLQPNPCVESCNIKSKSTASVVGLLLNGCLTNLKSIKVGQQHYTINYTCAFDSISQLMMCAYADSEHFSNVVDEAAADSLFFKLIQDALRDGITTQTYRKRAQILIKIDAFEKQEIGDTIVIDVSCTATFLIEHLFRGQPSFQEHKECEICQNVVTRDHMTMLVNLHTPNLTSLEQSVNIVFTDFVQCKECAKKQLVVHVSRTINLRNYLIIELVLPRSRVELFANEIQVPLNDIPKSITVLGGKQFTLRGVIVFRSPVTKGGMGHYTAYCWRTTLDKWELYDDMSCSIKYVRASTRVKIHFLFYSL